MKIRCCKAAVVLTLTLFSGLAAVLTVNSAALALTVTYTEANINSSSSVYFDPAPDDVRDDTGADVELGPITGSHLLSYCGDFSSCANYVTKRDTDAVYAKASLQTGTLKTKAFLQWGSNIFVNGTGVALGFTNGFSGGDAEFADSFRTYSGNTPFLWTSGTTATFHFGVTGQVMVNGTVPNPADYNPPKPLDSIYGSLTVNIFKPGTIDLLRQLKDFDINTQPIADFLALANQIEANLITRDYWYFGQVIADFSVDPAKVLPIDPNTPTELQFTFTPGGDFDWQAFFDTTVQLDANLQNVSATLDFSNSTVSSYDGPPGTTTYSGSGLFPSTVPFGQIPPTSTSSSTNTTTSSTTSTSTTTTTRPTTTSSSTTTTTRLPTTTTTVPPTVQCPLGTGFWKNHPAQWPVSALTLGSQAYAHAELLTLLTTPVGGDASLILAERLIAAKLNIANGSNPTPIASIIADADSLLSGFTGKLPYKVSPNSATWRAMVHDASILAQYNSGALTPTCSQTALLDPTAAQA